MKQNGVLADTAKDKLNYDEFDRNKKKLNILWWIFFYNFYWSCSGMKRKNLLKIRLRSTNGKMAEQWTKVKEFILRKELYLYIISKEKKIEKKRV